MRRALTLGLLAVLLVLPLTAPAQVRRRPAGQPPTPSPDAVARDAEQVAEEATARARAERLLRAQGVPGVPPVRHPALDEDAVGALQSRALQRALRR
jgi:hypothetical protein